MTAEPLPPDFFARDPLICARDLIGCVLANGACSGLVIETEAYHETGDPASHLFTRPSTREFARRHAPGTAYVYLNYGVHWLANVLCRDEATGVTGIILFRALEPLTGIDDMVLRRKTTDPLRLCSGPGKLVSALGIDGTYHSRSLVGDTDFRLCPPPTAERPAIVTDRRIGISSGKELEWRFLAKDHPGVSVKVGKAK